MKRILNPFWLVLSIILICLSVTVLFMFIRPFNTGPMPDAELFSRYGSFIGGVVGTFLSILSVILIYNTFQSQRNQLSVQETFFKRERFESLFFEMVRSNRQIVAEMLFKAPDDYMPADSQGEENGRVASYVQLSGQKIFVKFRLHFIQAMTETKDLIANAWDNNNLFSDETARAREEALFSNYLGNRYNPDILRKAATVNIIYHCVFYGVSRHGQVTIINMLKKTYNEQLLDKVVARLGCKPVKWSKYWGEFISAKKDQFVNLNLSDFPDSSLKYYGGHHQRLGHYFRQMFTLLNFVNNEPCLSFNDRMHYIKVFRSQLSTYEQAVFFLNSLSFLGRIWEIEAEQNLKPDKISDKRLISKYNLVKNMSDFPFADIVGSDFYPLVEFEAAQPILEKEELKKYYN